MHKVKKQTVIYAAAVIICIILPFIGGYIASKDGEFYAPSDGSEYVRAKVEKLLYNENEYAEDGSIISYDAVFEADCGDGRRVIAFQNFSSHAPTNPRKVEAGDSVIIAKFGTEEKWHFIEFVRSDAIIVLSLIFIALLILFGRKKGMKTVLSLILTVLSVVLVFIPAVLSGGNVYFWAIAVCIYMIFMTFLITGGLSPMSLAAALGCSSGVMISLLLTLITDSFIHITPNADSNALYLMYVGEGLDVRAIIFASVIIGCVGAVMDVSVDIAASLKELTVKLGTPTKKELFRSGINIGRDVIGTMANTLVLAYIGGSMCSLLLYFYNNLQNPAYLFNIEIVVVEMLNILVGSIGILLTLPLTAFISSRLYTLEPMRLFILREAEAAERIRDGKSPKMSKKAKKAKVLYDSYSDILEDAGEFETEDKKGEDGK